MRSSGFRYRIKELRTQQTEAEQKLWTLLRSRRFSGFKFRRQQPIDRYIADFCCLEAKLVIEVDGGHHAEQMEDDERRTQYLEENGFKVLRFWNNEVMKETHSVLEMIHASLLSPSPGLRPPSPARGEGTAPPRRSPETGEGNV
jgi:very-short-patch-repair endonuclease